MNFSQTYEWGKDDGCDHFKICPKGKEYCPATKKGQNMCTLNHLNKAYCADLKDFMEGCHMIRSLSSTSCIKEAPGEVKGDPEEVFGPHSRCFEWRDRLGDTPTTYVQCHHAKVNKKIEFF